MKFRFLGDGDCPDWLLAQICIMSRMTSIKIKLLSQLIAKSILDDNKLEEDKVKKLTQDAKIDTDELKGIIVALKTIFTYSARYGANSDDLSSELQQLGLPREHSIAIGRVHTDNHQQIHDYLTSQSLRLSHLSSVERLTSTEDPVPSTVFTKLLFKQKKVDGKECEFEVNIPRSDIPVLLEELKKAQSIMKKVI
ncbi:COMM domain-containing protein 4 [Chelonus insularis]|uniref:COMM domain-containing protein 4 n=1 Tax=Chelonus insularis TaxID=460826 RepID=UPI00158BA1AA|nr:COMM domain-containing protein 4 [Chelonus insularis]